MAAINLQIQYGNLYSGSDLERFFGITEPYKRYDSFVRLSEGRLIYLHLDPKKNVVTSNNAAKIYICIPGTSGRMSMSDMVAGMSTAFPVFLRDDSPLGKAMFKFLGNYKFIRWVEDPELNHAIKSEFQVILPPNTDLKRVLFLEKVE